MRIIFLILITFFSAQVTAGLSLSQAIVHFEENGKRSEDVTVFNRGKETLYVRVEPSVILNPGAPEQKRQTYRDPRAAGLLVTPQRLVIAPGAKKRLRFVRMDNPKLMKKDNVFRVLVKPEVGEVKSDKTAVKIIIAYEVLVLAQPAEANHQIEYTVKNQILKVTKKGNTNFLLQKGIQCPLDQSVDDEKNECQELSGKRVYAGSHWEKKLPYSTPIRYQISIGKKNELMVFEPTLTK